MAEAMLNRMMGLYGGLLSKALLTPVRTLLRRQLTEGGTD